MAKRDGKTITLGSGKLYVMAFSSSMPTSANLCVDGNLLGYIKGGATLTYTQETYKEEDDLGYVQKIITTSENVVLTGGVLTWNGNTLKKLVDRCNVTESTGVRTTKIGGDGNTQGNGYYAIGFKHEDSTDGDVVVMIKGRNTAGFEISFTKDAGTVINPEFTAVAQDTDGTLVVLEETIPTT